MTHQMKSSFYHGLDVTAIPTKDIIVFALENEEQLRICGWSDRDIEAVKEEARKRTHGKHQ